MVDRREGERIAVEVMKLLGPACEQMIIAGSIRRLKPFPEDVELVVRPRLTTDQLHMFDAEDEEISALDRHVERLLLAEQAEPRPRLAWSKVVKANGTRYKRLTWCGKVEIDLFAVLPPAQWGALLAIRTGPADFGHLLVTKQCYGGAMPSDWEQKGGALWRPTGCVGVEKVETPTEESYFAALGLPCWPPEERNAGRLWKFLHERNRHARSVS